MTHKHTKYLLVMREDTNAPWTPWPYFCDTLPEAQRKLLNASRGSPYQYDIHKCESITKSMCGEEKSVCPEVVKYRDYT